jgi:Surface-adhesin protein E
MQHRIEFAHLVAIAACAVASACSTTSGSGGGSGSGGAATGGQAAQWVSVAKADTQEAFVDPASLTFTGSMVDVRAKQNFASPQTSAKKDKTYLSSQSNYRVDCAARKVAYRDIQAYEAADLQGPVVQKATFTEKNLQWMDAPKGTVFGELLDYACEHAPASLPATPPG